ncbi:MAG: hypothetical protein AVDCRST_MAG01-01-1670 [uncultured Rubrobacteraceae bacterium]|uniref:Uncharacterized protein n=1 Tax=uncultured Rubrobacteraceae bacterium TaxID=349277 RepID=A0A6J4PBT6_9ACTN|nr:MAG: hypothetical protein AVDCRST_MAG01-01-1670 [uncultured Rubrobacteraceae bacterium]
MRLQVGSAVYLSRPFDKHAGWTHRASRLMHPTLRQASPLPEALNLIA